MIPPGRLPGLGGFATVDRVSEVAQIVRSLLSRHAPQRDIRDDDDLLGSGLLDSVGVLGLVAGLEESFRLRIDVKHLTEDNFRSLRAIADLVCRLIAERDER